jgi:hypothetical protein
LSLFIDSFHEGIRLISLTQSISCSILILFS